MQLTTIVLQTLSLALLAQAQVIGTSNVTCLPGFDWVMNSLGQTPCVVGGYLASECYKAPWDVPPLAIGSGPGSGAGPYSSPGFGGSQPSVCRCNTVDYNLIQACALCQGGLVGSWQAWTQQCQSSLINVGKYPEPVPNGTAIPTYAFYDSSGSQFEASAAQQFAANHSGKKQSHTGAIVGGVVGGVVGLIVIAIALIYLLKPEWIPKWVPERFRPAKKSSGQDIETDKKDDAYLNSPEGSMFPQINAVLINSGVNTGATDVSRMSALPGAAENPYQPGAGTAFGNQYGNQHGNQYGGTYLGTGHHGDFGGPSSGMPDGGDDLALVGDEDPATSLPNPYHSA